MNKKIILVHGWGGSSTSEPWFVWLRKECVKNNWELIAPEMPDSENPRMNDWVQKLGEVSSKLDDDTYFIGHSLGCQAIIRYLSTLDEGIVAGGAVFIAPWTKLDEKSIEEEGEESVNIVKSWISEPIDFGKAVIHLKKVVAIFSKNDPYVPLSEKNIFQEKLNAKVIIKENEEHFNKTEEINEILEALE
jgi:hypothetical protein